MELLESGEEHCQGVVAEMMNNLNDMDTIELKNNNSRQRDKTLHQESDQNVRQRSG